MSEKLKFPTFPEVRLAARLDGVSESATLRLNSAVQALKARGLDVVNLTAGEPDAFVPDSVKEAAIRAVRENKSKYTPVAGIPELRDAIAARTNAQHPALPEALRWGREDVLVTNGAKQAIFQSLLALVGSGDEVLIPSPYWLSYPEMTRLAQAQPVPIETRVEQDYKLTPEQLTGALTDRTRVLILNSPSNPTGAVYSRSELRALGEVLLSHPLGKSVWVISDEIYDRLVLAGGSFCSFLDAVPEWRGRTVTVNGLSKSAAMTGWRVGWSVAPRVLTQAMGTLQGQATSNVNAVAQWASLAALHLPESHYVQQVGVYRARREIVLKSFEKLWKSRKIEMNAPQGAFYLWMEAEALCRAAGLSDAGQLAERILEEARVAVVPGSPFGRTFGLRLSYATDEKTLADGCARLVRALETLS